MNEPETFEGWAICELMGRNVIAGYCTSQVIAGVAMLRVDVPAVEERAAYSKFFSGGSIYAITPTDEETAKTAARNLRTRPIDLWIVPQPKALPAPSQQPGDLPDDDYSDRRNDYSSDDAEDWDDDHDQDDDYGDDEEDEDDDDDDYDDSELDTPDLGPCCVCGQSGPTVRNLLMLHKRAPTPGTGWGCFQCGLPLDGATAVVCDACMESGAKIVSVCDGRPGEGKRVPVDTLAPEPFDHDLSKHPEIEEM